MLICGLKLTHDGSVAVVNDGKLVFCTEMEKINNNPRYSSIEDASVIADVLAREGISINDIDRFAVDGWGGYDQDALAIQPRLKISTTSNLLSIRDGEKSYELKVSHYEERRLDQDILSGDHFDSLFIRGKSYSYDSYLHVTDHVLSAYCTSPFAQKRESSYVLIWDGGMYPRLYYFNADTGTVTNLGPLFLLIGNIYTIFSQHFGPFKNPSGFAKDDLSIAGKVMAYIAYGTVQPRLFTIFRETYERNYDSPMGFANVFAREVKNAAGNAYSDEDMLLSFHVYVEELLVEKLAKKLSRFSYPSRNLCFAGGCALNIKWNSAIRSAEIFDDVYVPPFPNDSGSAIGAACATMLVEEKRLALDWNVFSGPALVDSDPVSGWIKKECSLEGLASLLFHSNEPVIFLNDRAELGPRALGNRSILANPAVAAMKDILNLVKKREKYRPVSPICLESESSRYFSPGGRDPFMLFDHMCRENIGELLPAICHLDGSARLQTITPEENPKIARLLREFAKLSGFPVLCNTSANLNGSGFFPDARSAAGLDKINYIWCNGLLYERENKTDFKALLENMELTVK